MATRWYYDEEGNYIGQYLDEDPIPPEYITYTYIAPPSLLAPSIDYPDGPFGVGSPIEKWDFIGGNWFVPFTLTRLKKYRDNQTNVELEYDNTSTVFNILLSPDSYTAISRIGGAIPIKPPSDGTIQWKNIDGQYYEADFADMQKLYERCYDREQNCRKAESYVLGLHAGTPYEDFADAVSDFDDRLVFLGETL